MKNHSHNPDKRAYSKRSSANQRPERKARSERRPVYKSDDDSAPEKRASYRSPGGGFGPDKGRPKKDFFDKRSSFKQEDERAPRDTFNKRSPFRPDGERGPRDFNKRSSFRPEGERRPRDAFNKRPPFKQDGERGDSFRDRPKRESFDRRPSFRDDEGQDRRPSFKPEGDRPRNFIEKRDPYNKRSSFRSESERSNRPYFDKRESFGRRSVDSRGRDSFNKRPSFRPDDNRAPRNFNRQEDDFEAAPTVDPETSWESVHSWYNQSVGKEGSYYHQHLILPNLLAKWDLKKGAVVLDLACGQGVLARSLPKSVTYHGVDISPSLIASAEEQESNPLHTFSVADLAKPLDLDKKDFTHAAIILALQNLEHPLKALQSAADHLATGGQLAIILNHPCFRNPRQSSWGHDPYKKVQYRRLDEYMSSRKVPIQAHPGQDDESPTTFSFHWPLAKISAWLQEAGFAITSMDEWCSDKVSEGGRAKIENRARDEFPLFLALFVTKLK